MGIWLVSSNSWPVCEFFRRFFLADPRVRDFFCNNLSVDEAPYVAMDTLTYAGGTHITTQLVGGQVGEKVLVREPS